MPTNETPESPLDRIARDLSRTLLHGARPTDNSGRVRPATVHTAQQLPVNLPAGDMTFAFSAGASTQQVVVAHGDAANADQFMTDAVGAAKNKYLSLNVDPGIPSWVFQQRQYSLANPPADADSMQAGGVIVAKLPSSVLQEAGNAGTAGQVANSYVSLSSVDPISQKATPIALASWQPAIFLRFPLRTLSARPPGLPDTMQVYELVGTPEGDRWFLDQLGLLPGHAVTQPVTIAGISLALEKKDSTGKLQQIPLAEWSIARSNLSQESRPGVMALDPLQQAAVSLPYIVLSGDPGQDQDTARLLCMASITNSGGYFLGATTNESNAASLVFSLLIVPTQDPDVSHPESGFLPLAANAIAFASGTKPDTVRFNGALQIEVRPYTPPGTVSFGWTRQVPAATAPASDEDKFGYGSLSLVDYSATDGSTQPVPFPSNAIPVISPMQALAGDPVPLQASAKTGYPAGTSALRLSAPSAKAGPRNAPADTEIHYYRGTLVCYDKASESPWKRLADPQQRKISVQPGFRDIFGNHFAAAQGPAFERRLFYTDEIVNPADWPGLHFAIYPELKASQAYLSVELLFSPGSPGPAADDTCFPAGLPGTADQRGQKLREIAFQLRGVTGDVSVSLLASPLVSGASSLGASVIADQLDKWASGDATLVLPLGSFPCTGSGAVTDLTLFEPSVHIERTKDDYLPLPTDLPPDDQGLATLIRSRIKSVTSPIAMQASAAPPAPPVAGAPERHDEFGAVALALQQMIASTRDFQVGLLRDHLNQHEIRLVPNKFFPAPPLGDDSAKWSFATPCPLRNVLGNESYQGNQGVPDFTKNTTADPQWRKYGLPLFGRAAVDQDFDELGRAVFRMFEKDTADLSQLMLRANALNMRLLLKTRENIALQLSTFNGYGNTTGFVTPLLAQTSPDDLDPKAINRIAMDAFLGDLSAFYAVSTIVQLPLNRAGNNSIQTFQGTVDISAAADAAPDPKGPKFSDVLLSGGDPKVTFLYDLPSGATDAPALPAMKFNITHLQLPLPGAKPGASPFNEGPWIELAARYVVQWTPPTKPIPVAVRSFPSKPILQSAICSLPDLGPVNSDGALTITAANAALLAQWGWNFSVSLVNGVDADRVHVTVRYPQQSPVASALKTTNATDWEPVSLLHTLYVAKLLRDNWDSSAIAVHRLDILQELTQWLLYYLVSGPVPCEATAMPAANPDPVDNFIVNYLVPGHNTDALQIMKDISAVWATASTAVTRIDTVAVNAPGESKNNTACLTGANPVRAYHLSLVLKRNESFLDQGANCLLIYQCAPVESLGDCLAGNGWGPLIFDRTNLTLLQAFQFLFNGLLHGADLNQLDLEAGAHLVWSKGAMTAVTSFSIMAADMKPADRTANGVATAAYNQCMALLGNNTPPLPETDSRSIRLRVKITPLQSDALSVPRILVEIPAIDFAI